MCETCADAAPLPHPVRPCDDTAANSVSVHVSARRPAAQVNGSDISSAMVGEASTPRRDMGISESKRPYYELEIAGSLEKSP